MVKSSISPAMDHGLNNYGLCLNLPFLKDSSYQGFRQDAAQK